MIFLLRRPALLLAFLGPLLTVSAASALTLTSTAAGFAGTETFGCETNANNFEIEVLYNSAQGCRRHGIVEVSLAGSGLTEVSSAIITLFDGAAANMEGFFFTVDLYGYVGDGQVTGSDIDAGSYIGTATWARYGLPERQFALDVTDFVNGQLALGTEIIGINIRSPFESFNCCTTTFLSFDGATGDHPPTLALEPVPLPAGAWLFGSALGGLGWVTRKGVVSVLQGSLLQA